jgi:YVTN family beta-propeller protein
LDIPILVSEDIDLYAFIQGCGEKTWGFFLQNSALLFCNKQNSHGEDPGTVSVINLSTNIVCAIIPVEVYPHGIAIHPNGLWAYVSGTCDERVSVINTMRNEVETTVHTGIEPLGIAITPDGHSLCVANTSERTVSIISTSENKETAVIRVGEKPREVAIASIVITDPTVFHMS